MNETQPDGQPAPALIAEATKRAGLLWVQVGGRPARAAWHVWAASVGPGPGEGAAYLLTGPGEQHVPGLSEAGRIEVIVPSKEPGGSAVRWSAEVGTVEPGGAEWDLVIGALLAGRLNEPLAVGEVSPAERWRATCAVRRLRPARGSAGGSAGG